MSRFWDERYSAAGYGYGTEPNDFLRAEAHRIPPGRVLSLGEGEGRNAVFVAGLGHDVVGVDSSPVGLAKAAALAQERGVSGRAQFVVDDFETYVPSGEYSGVVIIFIPLHERVRPAIFARCADALVEGGVIVLELYGPGQLAHATGGPKDRAMLPSQEELVRELTAAGLVVDLARELDRDVVEGVFHTGRASTVQIIARKPAR